MPQITILCPWHGTEEKISIPDSYTFSYSSSDSPVTFADNIPCGHSEVRKRRIVHVRIRFQRGKSPLVEHVTAVRGGGGRLAPFRLTDVSIPFQRTSESV
ncbi:MAG: hypothetical protein HYX80_08510 [Chloroflexi bacterium]|nr:hypothetical protein [Chloroflexota bacterium]